MSRRHNIVSEISSDFLTCHICLETYERPKTLHCGHFFCRDCLLNYFKKSQQTAHSADGRLPGLDKCRFSCPTCRVELGIIQTSCDAAEYVDNLPDNFYVNSLKDLVADHSKGRSTRSKSDAGDGLNPRQVQSENILRSRSMSEAFQTASPSYHVDKVSAPCVTHPDSMVHLYCLDHLVLLCESCRVLDHKDCTECISLEEAENTAIRTQVQQMIKNLSSSRSTLLQTIGALTLKRHSLQIDLFNVDKQIDDMKVNLEAKISRNVREMKENLRKVTSVIDINAAQKLESAKLKESLITEMIENFQLLVKKGNVFELVSALSKADSPLNEESIHQSCSTAIHYRPNELIDNLLQSSENVFGDVTTIRCDITCTNNEGETQGAIAMPFDAPTEQVKETALEICGTDANRKGPSVSFNYHRGGLGLTQESVRILSSTMETFKLPTGMESTSRCCILKTGDIALLDSANRSVNLLGNSGVFLASVFLPTIPLGLTACKDSKRKGSLAVTGQESTIYFLSTMAGIKLAYVRLTRAQYSDVAAIPKRLSLLAMAEFENPPFLDLISLQGQVLRTLQTTAAGIPLFVAPKRLATSLEYIFVLDNNCLRLLSWESELISTIKTFQEFAFRNLSTISGNKYKNACLFVDSQEGRVFSLSLECNNWKLEKIIDDTGSILEPCDLSMGINAFALLVGGCSVWRISLPEICKGQTKQNLLSDLDEKYQTQ